VNFEEFEKLVKTHKGTSVILIVLFMLGVIFQITDSYTKISSLFKPNLLAPEIKTIDLAKNKSVYVEYGKLTDSERKTIKPTQLSNPDINIRQFVYDHEVIDRLYYSKDAIKLTLFANAIINHGLSSGVISKNSSEHEFLHELVQKRNFMNLEGYLYSEILPRKRLLKVTGYSQASNERVSLFMASLEHLEQHNGRNYQMHFKTVSRGEIEDLIERYAPIIRNQFEPVFEVTLFNPNESEILIKSIDLVVDEVVEYKGVGEKPARSDILTFRLPTKPGRINKDIDDLLIKPKSHLKILVRLEPQQHFSTYRLKLEFNWGYEGVVATEYILVDA
jgi:hypothetical protein